MLITEIIIEENAPLPPGVAYAIYTPLGNEAAAQVLYDALKAKEDSQTD
jgi:hypothetical protein